WDCALSGILSRVRKRFDWTRSIRFCHYLVKRWVWLISNRE
ncbi:hypothetical protein DYADSP32_3573, partial [Dyadobacter sp. 32]